MDGAAWPKHLGCCRRRRRYLGAGKLAASKERRKWRIYSTVGVGSLAQRERAVVDGWKMPNSHKSHVVEHKFTRPTI